MLELIIFADAYLVFGGLFGVLIYDKYIKGNSQPATAWISLVVMEIIFFCLLVLPAILKLSKGA